MKEMNVYQLSMTKEEIEACLDFLADFREQQAEKRAYEENRQAVRDIVSAVVDAIGVEKSINIVREILSDLRRTPREE